jgi:hypothetical protein
MKSISKCPEYPRISSQAFAGSGAQNTLLVHHKHEKEPWIPFQFFRSKGPRAGALDTLPIFQEQEQEP